jgi:hypothetical protein
MTTRKDETCKMILKVETGTSAKGKAVYSERTISHVSPVLADDDFLQIGQTLGSLQADKVSGIYRQDLAGLQA